MCKTSLTAFFAAALLGACFGWNAPVGFQRSPSRTHFKATAQGASGPRWTRADFLASARRDAGINPLAEELTDWTDAELVAALDSCLHNPDVIIPNGAGFGLDRMLLLEWLKRDFDSALVWFQELDSRPAQARLSGALDYGWPPDKAEQGFAFLIANRDLFLGSILEMVACERVRQGTEEFSAFLDTFREQHLQFRYNSSVEFPDGFDFPGLFGLQDFQALQDAGAAAPVMRAWQTQDRDAAYDWLLENQGVKSLGSLPWRSNEDTAENQRWLGKRFESLAADQRAEYAGLMRWEWLNSPSELSDFIQGIGDARLIGETLEIGAQAVFAGNARRVMPLLENIDSPARRIAILEAVEIPPVVIDHPYRRRFTTDDESYVRRKLAEWQATDPQIEAILTRIKP